MTITMLTTGQLATPEVVALNEFISDEGDKVDEKHRLLFQFKRKGMR